MPSSCDEPLDELAVGPVPDQAELRLDPALEEPGERADDVGQLLDRRHPADPPDDEGAVGNAEQPAELRPVALAADDPGVEVDAEPDDRELVGRGDPELDEIVAHLGADRYEPRRHAGQAPLDRAERCRAPRAEVAAQHVAVERVDDDGRPRVAGEERRGAADGACLCRVRVQDVRPHLLDQLHDRLHRERVEDRRELPVEVLHVDHLDAELFGDERHRALAPRDRAGPERRVVPERLEATREVGDVEGGPAHVQPRDQPQDADRLVLGAHRADERPPPSAASLPRARPRARSRAPRARPSGRPTSHGCRRGVTGRRPSPPAGRGSRRSCPRPG